MEGLGCGIEGVARLWETVHAFPSLAFPEVTGMCLCFCCQAGGRCPCPSSCKTSRIMLFLL